MKATLTTLEFLEMLEEDMLDDLLYALSDMAGDEDKTEYDGEEYLLIDSKPMNLEIPQFEDEDFLEDHFLTAEDKNAKRAVQRFHHLLH